MSDDEFAELMRRADPARATHQTLTEADILANLREVKQKARRARRRRQAWVALPGAAALLTALFVIQPWGAGAASAVAATPLMLGTAPIEADVQQVVDEATHRLTESPASVPERRAEFEGWYLDIEVGEHLPATVVVSPQRQVIQWRPDLSGRITTTAGIAFIPQDGRSYPPPDGAAPAPGTVLGDDEFAAGEMPLLFSSEPPSTAAGMRRYLKDSGLNYIDAVRGLLSEWRLGADQHAAVLQILSSLDDIEVVGEVTDRLGRPAIALRVSSMTSRNFEHLVLVSSESGRIIALERVYLGGLAELDLPTPSVVEYIAWR